MNTKSLTAIHSRQSKLQYYKTKTIYLYIYIFTLRLVMVLLYFLRPFFIKIHYKAIKTGKASQAKNCNLITKYCGFNHIHCYNSGIMVVLYNPLLYKICLLEAVTRNGAGRLQISSAAVMPYNYTLRHAVKCYNNNNINREQLQSQCKLYRRNVLFLQIWLRAKDKQHSKKIKNKIKKGNTI